MLLHKYGDHCKKNHDRGYKSSYTFNREEQAVDWSALMMTKEGQKRKESKETISPHFLFPPKRIIPNNSRWSVILTPCTNALPSFPFSFFFISLTFSFTPSSPDFLVLERKGKRYIAFQEEGNEGTFSTRWIKRYCYLQQVIMDDPTNDIASNHITQLSLHKLSQGERSRTEPGLRRQVLVRNILLMCLFPQQQKQRQQSQQEERTQEEVWLDACFDELEDDELMYDGEEKDEQDNEYRHPQQKSQQHLVLALPVTYVNHHPLLSGLPTDYDPDTQDSKGPEQLALVKWTW